MDTHEFRILSSEYFDRVEDAISRLPIDGIESRADGNTLLILCDGGSEIVLARNDEFQRITVRTAEKPVHYYYNDTEEDWYAVGGETLLFSDLSVLLSAAVGTALSLE